MYTYLEESIIIEYDWDDKPIAMKILVMLLRTDWYENGRKWFVSILQILINVKLQLMFLSVAYGNMIDGGLFQYEPLFQNHVLQVHIDIQINPR